jgi:hypothetical protein
MANVSEIEGGKKLIDRNPEGFIVCSKWQVKLKCSKDMFETYKITEYAYSALATKMLSKWILQIWL